MIRFHYSSMTTPSEVYDYDLRTRERDPAQAPGGAERPRSGRLRDPPPVRHGARTASRCRSRSSTARTSRSTARRPACSTATAPTACRCRPAFRDRPALAGRPRLRLRHRPYPRRQRDGLALVSWTASARRSPTPSPTSSPAAEALIAAGLHGARAHRRPWRQRRRHADGRGRQPARPTCSRGIVADVPFVDVLNTMLDDDLPLTPPEWPEWGNPIDGRGGVPDHPVLLALRQRRGRKAYPPILALGGLTDPRVTYWEPAKWVARLRATHDGRRPRSCSRSTWTPATAARRAASTAWRRSR